ncbi:MAG: tetratricopeptide repeat protein [Polyangiaceae bacterium]|nr:tetratricopeptide repeat protein [Polyangiaceae bacterium]
MKRRARRHGSLALAIALGSVTALGSATAQAGEPDASDPAGAEVLFQKGRAHMEQGDLAKACPIFDESYRLDPAPGTLLNIAACSRTAGKTATAWSQFVEAGRAFKRKGDARRAAFAEKQAAEIEPSLAYVVVRAERPVPKLVIVRDGTELTTASLETKLPMDPGEHVVIARAEGYEEITLRLSAEPRATTDWVIPELVAAKAKTPDKGAPVAIVDPPDRGRTQRIAGIVVGSVGLAALTAGAVFVGLTASKSSDLEELCPDKRCTTPEGNDALSEAGVFANAANGLLIGGAALAATGLVVILTAPSSERDDLSVRIVPTATGAAITGTF